MYIKPIEKLKMITDFIPAGDQPQAIDRLVKGLGQGKEHQVLLGVTGSGNTTVIGEILEGAKEGKLHIQVCKAANQK